MKVLFGSILSTNLNYVKSQRRGNGAAKYKSEPELSEPSSGCHFRLVLQWNLANTSTFGSLSLQSYFIWPLVRANLSNRTVNNFKQPHRGPIYVK